MADRLSRLGKFWLSGMMVLLLSVIAVGCSTEETAGEVNMAETVEPDDASRGQLTPGRGHHETPLLPTPQPPLGDAGEAGGGLRGKRDDVIRALVHGCSSGSHDARSVPL